MYRRATATARILFDGFGTVRLTVSLSSSESMEGMASRMIGDEVGLTGGGK
jgi:hypothetical protein